jgi:hypothetical protein
MSLLQTMIKHTGGTQEATAGNDTIPNLPPQPPQPAIYVSTGLDVREIDGARDRPEDDEIDGTLFRRLSPEYFSWLRSRMVTAQAAHQSGKLSDSAWEILRERFNRLQEMAITAFGKATLQQALRDFNPKSYLPPVVPKTEPSQSAEPVRKDWLFPAGQAWKCRRTVTSQVVAKVDAIGDAAMAKGWSEARLYQNQGRFRFPCGEDYGLVCFVDGSRRIGEITARYIEIIHEVAGRENRLRFFNPDVDQPWLNKMEKCR